MRNKLKPCYCGLRKVYAFGLTDEKGVRHTWDACWKHVWVKEE